VLDRYEWPDIIYFNYSLLVGARNYRVCRPIILSIADTTKLVTQTGLDRSGPGGWIQFALVLVCRPSDWRRWAGDHNCTTQIAAPKRSIISEFS
jgi:hypothetical protein